jgi:hypothetical protein
MSKVSGRTVRASWFNPRQGVAEPEGEFTSKSEQVFAPPYSGRNNDWVLILDDGSANLPRVQRGDWVKVVR